MTLVSFVLLNHNSGKYVESLINSLAEQTNSDWELVVVDNASSDDSLDRIINQIKKNKIEHWRELRLDKNLHFAKGMNAGIKIAKGELIVPLNTDVFLSNEFVETLSLAFRKNKKQKVGTFAGNEFVWDWEGNDLTERLRSSGTVFVRRIGLSTWDPEYEPTEKLLGPSGAAPVVTRKALEKIKLQNGDYYDSRFISFGEDIDLYLRIRLNGFRSCYLPKLCFWHIGSASYGGKDISLFSKSFYLIGIILANKWRIWKRIPSLFERILIFPLILFLHIVLFIVLCVKKGLKGMVKVVITYIKTLINLNNEKLFLYPMSPEKRGLYAGWIFSRSEWEQILQNKQKSLFG